MGHKTYSLARQLPAVIDITRRVARSQDIDELSYYFEELFRKRNFELAANPMNITCIKKLWPRLIENQSTVGDNQSYWRQGYQLMLDSVLYTASRVANRAEYLDEFFNKTYPTPMESMSMELGRAHLVCVFLKCCAYVLCPHCLKYHKPI